jgi:hypothetical protein
MEQLLVGWFRSSSRFFNSIAIPSLFGQPSSPPSLWNLFREKEPAKKTETRAGGQTKEKPIPDEGDGSSFERLEVIKQAVQKRSSVERSLLIDSVLS